MVTTTADINNSTVTSTPTNTAKKAASASAQKGGLQSLADNFDTFLTLLTTQLKNQDPTSPMETNEFTNQLVAFTGVEQQIKGNDHLEDLITLSKANQSSSSVSYIGKYAQTNDNRITLENQKSDFSYEITGEAKQAAITITSDSGAIIYSEIVDKPKSGLQKLTWDGRTTSGGQAKDGAYKIAISASDANGNQLSAKTYTAGKVTAADFGGDEVILTVGGNKIPISKILSISETQNI